MCSYCGKLYSSVVNLRRHQQIHEEPQHCHCGATFTTKEALKEHENAKHKSLYFCKKCPNLRRFSSRSGLFAHNVKAHKADTSLKCEICDRRFGQLGHLKDHMNAHSDEAKYECNSCGSKFKFHTSLRNHEKICTGEVIKRGRPKSKTSVSSTIPATPEKVVITCEKCGKTFCDQRYLKQHEQKHLGNIKLCPNCGKSFKFQSSLSRHIKACSKKGLEDSSVSSMDVLELSATKYEGSEHMKTSSENVVDDSDELYIKTVLVISSADTDNHTVASVDQMSSPDHVTASANALMPSVDHVTFSAGHMLSSASHVMPGVNHVTTTVSEPVDSSDYSRVPSATITNVLPRTTAVESGNVMVLSGNTNVINDENAIVE